MRLDKSFDWSQTSNIGEIDLLKFSRRAQTPEGIARNHAQMILNARLENWCSRTKQFEPSREIEFEIPGNEKRQAMITHACLSMLPKLGSNQRPSD